MQGSNFRQNNEYFRSLALEVASEEELKQRIRAVTPMQAKVGQLIKFSYSNTGRDYTALIAATPRAPGGLYTTANTRNTLLTMFLLDNYAMDTQAEFLRILYAKRFLAKNKMVSYKPQSHNEYKSRMQRFWSNIMEKINLRVKSKTKLDSRNFRTFMARHMQHCKVLS